MNIQHKNIIIRNATQVDAGQLVKWWNDGKVMAHAGFPNGLNYKEKELSKDLEQDSDYTSRRLIIEYDKKVIGEANFKNLGDNKATIGINICNSTMQNKGIGKIAISMLLNELFTKFNFNKILLDTNFENTRARFFYKSIGFKEIEIKENYFQNQLGEWQTASFFELCKKDFINKM